MGRVAAEMDVTVCRSDVPGMEESQPMEIALFQPIEVVREMDPGIAARLEDLWGCDALHVYIDSLIRRTPGARRAPMDARMLSALLALAEHQTSRLKSDAPLGPITAWVLDRVRVNALISPLLRGSRTAPLTT